ncbi:MAG: glycosyltransferase family 2 protein, partial [Verrucomicrobiales bacterium]
MTKSDPAPPTPRISVIVCTRNGRDRIPACLRSLTKLTRAADEILVVDDGSTDGTADSITRHFPQVTVLPLPPCGLSAARNAGAHAATGEILAYTDDDCEVDPDWLTSLAQGFSAGWDAVGGPNLPPPPAHAIESMIAAAPGAASHVMLDDQEAEHIPGCNLAVRRTAFFEIGGFDPDFRTAGDDVDFCWRLQDAGKRIGFAPTAFVWHHRRATLWGYLKQQTHYGKAEALLMKKHPSRFTPSGDARWQGIIYTGSPVRVTGAATIYHGAMGLAGYQKAHFRMQPLRDLPPEDNHLPIRWLLKFTSALASRLRTHARTGQFRAPLRERRGGGGGGGAGGGAGGGGGGARGAGAGRGGAAGRG